MTEIFDIAIIGSGPAGLAAAHAAVSNGKKVVILEKMAKPSLKLLASGGGRCNVSNTLELEEFAMRFGRNWRFMLPALSLFSGEKMLQFFRKNQLPLILEDGFHYFPATGSARDVRDVFLKEIYRHDGKLFCNCRVLDLKYDHDLWQLTATDRNILARKVICACGGRGYPALGGSTAGYELIGKLGHKVTDIFPAMTGVITADDRIGECAGISLENCRTILLSNGKKIAQSHGELLFTHHGFSAFAILDITGEAAKAMASGKTVSLQIDFLPEWTKEKLHDEFLSWRKTGGTKRISTLLSDLLPRRLAQFFLAGDDPEISHWQSASCRRLEELLKGAVFNLKGVESWEKAMVTAGGVSLKEVSPHTLESKIFPGLFFAGEMLDITGPCGGFNITWAMASGMLAGTSAAGK